MISLDEDDGGGAFSKPLMPPYVLTQGSHLKPKELLTVTLEGYTDRKHK